jgi:hypothetical protein
MMGEQIADETLGLSQIGAAASISFTVRMNYFRVARDPGTILAGLHLSLARVQ